MSRNNTASVLLGLVICLATPLVALAQKEVQIPDRSDWTTQNILRLGGSLNNTDPGLNFNGTDFYRDGDWQAKEKAKKHEEVEQKSGTADVKMVRTFTRNEFERTVSGKVSGQYTNGLLDIKGGAAATRQVRFDRTSLTVAFVATVTFKRADAGSLYLSPIADKELANLKNDPNAGQKVVNLFGTHVLSGITHEGRIVLVQNYKFSSEMKCREASAKLEASYGPTSIAAEVSTAMKQIDTKSEMDVYYYQDCVNLKAVDLAKLFSLKRDEQLKGLSDCLGAFDSTGCPITIRWLTSLRDVPEIKSMMQKNQLPGLEDELQKHEKLSGERSRVAKWLEEAVVTRDVLERVRDIRVHHLKVDPSTRSEDFAKSVAAVQDWLNKPKGQAPELPSTTITKADVEGAIIRSHGWVFGQHHQHQIQNKGKIVIDFRCSPSFDVLMPEFVVKAEMVRAGEIKGGIDVRPEHYKSYRELAFLVERGENTANHAACGYMSQSTREDSPYARRNLVAGTSVGLDFTSELSRKKPKQAYPSNTLKSVYDTHRAARWKDFYDNYLSIPVSELRFRDKWGHEHVVDLGKAKDAPGIAETEETLRPKPKAK